MITVITGTNRKGSEAAVFSRAYAAILAEESQEEVKFLALEEITHDWFHPDMYEKEQQTSSLREIQDEYMIPAEKFVFLISEYNGSYPGSLKVFIDGISIREYKPTFKGKKAALVGVASGRAGGLRALDQFSDVLMHVGTVVMPKKLPISSIGKLVNSAGEIAEATLEDMRNHAKELLVF